jgi:hypothetical protein
LVWPDPREDVMKIWSRRKFLEAGVISSIAMSSAAAASLTSTEDGKAGQKQHSVTATPQAKERNLLTVVVDEIIPASDGMPAASEVAGVDYLEKLSLRDTKAAKEIHQGLTSIENLSQNRFQASFVSLSQERRVAVLTSLQTQDPGNFNILRDYIYEAYYEQTQVWKLIDYTCYETNGGGPAPEPFREEILSEVRKKPKGYREA